MPALPAYIFAAAFLGAFLGAGLALPWWRRWCRQAGVVDDPGRRKIHQTPVPLAGGLAVLSGVALPIVAGGLAAWLGAVDPEVAGKILHGLSKRLPQLLVILGGAAAMGLLGWLDDLYELRPAQKFAGQCVIALLAAWWGERITLFVGHPAFHLFITAFWIVAVTNAFNLSDNMNGLCAGLAAIAAGSFALHGLLHGYYLVALLSLTIGGAVLGFLPYNYPRATAFLGDSGSHLIGFLMAKLAIMPHFYAAEHPHPLAVLSPLVVLAVPLGDMAWVTLARAARGQPFYVGDTNHVSHRLARALGGRQSAAVALLWLAGLAAAALASLLW